MRQARADLGKPARHLRQRREFGRMPLVARRPREDRHVGDRVGVADEVRARHQLAIECIQCAQPPVALHLHQRGRAPRQLAGQRSEHGRADGDTQGIQAHQQARRGDADGKVCRHGGQQAHDHELGRADGECAERQREQGNGHGRKLLRQCVDGRSVEACLLREK